MSLSKLKRRFHISRRKQTDVTVLTLQPEDIEDLRFYQLKTSSPSLT